nr:hypothetical protein [Actinomycetota bacterium]
MNAKPPSENSAPLRLTLDTNLLLELWKQHEKKGHVETLLQLAEQGRVQLAVTARVREDVPAEPLASRLDELPKLGIAETASVARLDFWVLGRDRLGDDDFVQFEAELAASVEPGRKPDWRDLDHLHAH